MSIPIPRQSRRLEVWEATQSLKRRQLDHEHILSGYFEHYWTVEDLERIFRKMPDYRPLGKALCEIKTHEQNLLLEKAQQEALKEAKQNEPSK